MSFDEKILLSIKREFSRNEKYRLFLRYLDNVEKELAAERKRNTKLLKEHNESKDDLSQCQEKLEIYEANGEPTKYVLRKTHDKMVKKKYEYETMYWSLFHEHEALKKEFEQLKNK